MSSSSTKTRRLRHPRLEPDWIDRPHLQLDLGDFPLRSGAVIEDAFLNYVIHGDPALLRTDRVLLLTTAIGSTHHRLDFLIGPGNALDSGRYCIVVVDAPGNGLSVSPSNSERQPGAAFPRFTIADMVASQVRLLDHLGVARVKAVVGASMGGMQALQWAVAHRDRLQAVVAMTPMARTARWSQLVNEMSRRALFVDADCTHPRERSEGMRLWAGLTQWIMPRTPQAAETAFASQAALLRQLAEREARLVDDGPDAFDWCYQTWAYDAHDVGLNGDFAGDTERALRSVDCPALIAAPRQDLYNPPFAARAIADALPQGQWLELPGDEGHAAASGFAPAPTAALRQAIAAFLNRLD